MSLHGRIAVIQRHTRVPVELEQPPERTDLRRREISGSSARFSPYASPSPRRRLGRINPRMWIRPKLVQALRARDWPSLPRPRLTLGREPTLAPSNVTLGREPTLAPSNVRREGRPKRAKTVHIRGLSHPSAQKSPKKLRRFVQTCNPKIEQKQHCTGWLPSWHANAAQLQHNLTSCSARLTLLAHYQKDVLRDGSAAEQRLGEGRDPAPRERWARACSVASVDCGSRAPGCSTASSTRHQSRRR